MYADRRTTCSLPLPDDFGAEEGSLSRTLLGRAGVRGLTSRTASPSRNRGGFSDFRKETTPRAHVIPKRSEESRMYADRRTTCSLPAPPMISGPRRGACPERFWGGPG